MRLALVIADLYQAQSRELVIRGMEHTLRPTEGWSPWNPIACQIRAGLKTQEREQRRCAQILACSVAANEGTA